MIISKIVFLSFLKREKANCGCETLDFVRFSAKNRILNISTQEVPNFLSQ